MSNSLFNGWSAVHHKFGKNISLYSTKSICLCRQKFCLMQIHNFITADVIVKGYLAFTVQSFLPKRSVRRAEMLKMLILIFFCIISTVMCLFLFYMILNIHVLGHNFALSSSCPLNAIAVC